MKRNEMKTLRLNLKSQWYDMIEQGIKTEEYREIKDFWIKRLFKDIATTWLCTLKLCINIKRFTPFYGRKIKLAYDAVTFVYGYTNRTMTFNIEYLTIGKGKEEWGAPAEDVFIIKLGKRID